MVLTRYLVVCVPRAFEKPEQLVGCFNKSTELQDSYQAFSYPNRIAFASSL